MKSNLIESTNDPLDRAMKIKLTGLGPRDTLRLQAALYLYGFDIDSMTTPVEASLTWTIAKHQQNLTDDSSS